MVLAEFESHEGFKVTVNPAFVVTICAAPDLYRRVGFKLPDNPDGLFTYIQLSSGVFLMVRATYEDVKAALLEVP